MPARNPDLHGNAPDKSAVALVLIDVINDLEFPEGEGLLQFALPSPNESPHSRSVRGRSACR